MTSSDVHRDERTLLVENASYRWAFHVFSFGLLLDVAYRSFVLNESAWDLFALIVLGGALASAYQWTHKVLTRRTAVTMAAAMAIAAVVAAVVAWLR